jgi:DNA-binding transcriptional LysR family regulator
MDHELELRHVRYFVAVAEELHFGRAAKRLHMAQPPLSQQIRKLEQLIGTPLLVRTSRRVALTAAGETFLDRGRRLLDQSQHAVDEAGRIGRGEQGRLDVGYISSAMRLGITERVRAFRLDFPSVHLQLHEGYTSQIRARVLASDVDMGIVRDTEADAALEVMTLATEPFVAVVPAGHPHAHEETLHAGALRDDPFVFYPRAAGERAFLRNLEPCRDAGYEPHVVQEASNWVTLLHLVEAGLGVTLAPRSATEHPPENVRVIPLREATSTSEVQLIRRAGDARAVLDNFAYARRGRVRAPDPGDDRPLVR